MEESTFSFILQPKTYDELKIQVERLENENFMIKKESDDAQILGQERQNLTQRRLNLAQEKLISAKEKIKELQQIREQESQHIKYLEYGLQNFMIEQNGESKEVSDQIQVEKDVSKVSKVPQQSERSSSYLFKNEQRNSEVNQVTFLEIPTSTDQISDNLSQAKVAIQGPIQDLKQINQAVQQRFQEKQELDLVDKQKLEEKVLELEGLLQVNKENQAVQQRLMEKQELDLVDKQKLEEKVLELEGLLQVNKENQAVQYRLQQKQELDLVDKQKLEEKILELEGFLQEKEEKFQEVYINMTKFKEQLQERTQEQKKNTEQASDESNKLRGLLGEQSLTFQEEKTIYINEAKNEAIKITEENENLLKNQQAKHFEEIKDHEIQFQLKIEQQKESNDILQKNQLMNDFELLTKTSSRMIVDDKQKAILSYDFRKVYLFSTDYSVNKVIVLRDQNNQSDFGEISTEKQIEDYHLALSKDHFGVVITWNNNMYRNIFLCDCEY